jgi:hypothetical protein
MNLAQNPSAEQLRSLLRGCDDQHSDHFLWVEHSGAVHITPDPPGVQSKFYFEGFLHGNGWTGPQAALDDVWVNKLLGGLMRSWQNGSTGYIDDAL